MLQEEKHAPKNVATVDQLQTGVDDHPSTLSVMEGYMNYIQSHYNIFVNMYTYLNFFPGKASNGV